MGLRRIPLYKAFLRIMSFEMSKDPEWLERMDEAANALPKGEIWPHELPKPEKGG